MAKHKRAWREPNPDHPRGKRGRFVKKGTGVVTGAASALAGLSGEKAAPAAPRNTAVRDFFRSRMAGQPAHDPAAVLAKERSPETRELRRIQARPTQALKRDLLAAAPGTRNARDLKAELAGRAKAARESTPERRATAKAAPTSAVSSVASKPVATAVATDATPTRAQRFERRAAAAASGDDALASAPIGMTDTLTHQIQYIEQTDRDVRGVTVAEAQVLRDYRLTFYERMNRNRRLGRRDPLNENLDTLQERSPLSRDVVVHRGVVDPKQYIPGWHDGDVTGLEWDEVANSSTTTEADKVKKFLGIGKGKDRAVEMRILVPQGVRAIQVSSRGEGGYESQAEAELLLEHGLRFRVVADHGFSKAETGPNGTKIKGGVRRIDVEIVPPTGGTAKG